MSDLLDRLRRTQHEWPFQADGSDGWCYLCQEAADEILRLRQSIQLALAPVNQPQEDADWGALKMHWTLTKAQLHDALKDNA